MFSESLSLELSLNREANLMQPPEIQFIIAAILTLAATPLKVLQPGTAPEAEVLRTYIAIAQALTGQTPPMSPTLAVVRSPEKISGPFTFRRVGELLRAVAAFAVGGVQALEGRRDRESMLLLEQMRKG